MSLSGRYKAENNDDYLSHYYIVMDVKETDKSYIFTLLELESRYSASHMQHLFSKSNRVIIRKNRGPSRPWCGYGTLHLLSPL